MMIRRKLLVFPACLLAATCLIQGTTAVGQDQPTSQKYLVLRHFVVTSPEKQEFILTFLREVAVPALNQIGVQPVGVFTVAPQQAENPQEADGPREADHSIYVLTQFDSLEDWASTPDRLSGQASSTELLAEYLGTPKDDPAYERIHVTVMKAFEGFPTIERPLDGPRVFELRTYESHNELKARLKVAMFNEGEIDVFHKVGMKPVFFGETMAGQNLPNLTYMLVYKDMEEHREVWQRFLNDPTWHAMRDNPRYADTVSGIRRLFLLPADFSQL